MTTYRACRCGARVIKALTGKGLYQILNYQPDPAGMIAARQDAAGGWHARTLSQGERPVPPERRYTHHYAVSPQCRPAAGQLKVAAQDVRDELAAWRARKSTAITRIPRGRGAKT